MAWKVRHGEPGMVAHLVLALEKQRQEDLWEFQARRVRLKNKNSYNKQTNKSIERQHNLAF